MHTVRKRTTPETAPSQPIQFPIHRADESWRSANYYQSSISLCHRLHCTDVMNSRIHCMLVLVLILGLPFFLSTFCFVSLSLVFHSATLQFAFFNSIVNEGLFVFFPLQRWCLSILLQKNVYQFNVAKGAVYFHFSNIFYIKSQILTVRIKMTI